MVEVFNFNGYNDKSKFTKYPSAVKPLNTSVYG